LTDLPPGFTSSGNVALDRRYRWAAASLEAGDANGARDILEQTVAEAPGWAPAWQLLGDARLACADAKGAREAYEESSRFDPQGTLGARLELARLGVVAPAEAIEPGYIAALFDDYADRFDDHLLGALGYRGPKVILNTLRRLRDDKGWPVHFDTVLDLGCGTGLMGEAIRPFAGRLVGVDLSARMIAKARAKLVYNRLVVGELASFLAGEAERGAELILAADVLVYIGDLAPILGEVGRVLTDEGLFAFTCQSAGEIGMEAGYDLGADRRFLHSPEHIRSVARDVGLNVLRLASVVTRREAGVDVPGVIVVLERPASPRPDRA
jgi:predicted TPR repeat methyltransferase